jgi:hypothetical protein
MAGLTRMTGLWNPGEDAYDEPNPSSYSEHRDAATLMSSAVPRLLPSSPGLC